MTSSDSPRPSPDSSLNSQQRRLLLVVWLGMFLVSLDVSALAIALPSIAAQLNAGLSAASWVSLAYLLAMAGLILPLGRLLEIFGHRPVLFYGFLTFALASLGCALSRDILLLSGLRLIQGTGAAALYVTGAAVIRSQLPSAAQARAFAVFTTAGSAGMCFGPAMGGFLTAHLGWPWIFFLNLPVSTFGLLLLWRLPATRPNPAQRPPFDLLGSLLAFVTLLGLVFGLNQGRELGWGSLPILASFAFAAIAGVCLLYREQRTSRPAFDLSLFLRPAYGLGSAGVFCFLLVVGGFLFLLPFSLQWFRGLTADQAGLMYLLHPIAMVLASLLLARWMSATRAWLFYLIGVMLLAGALLLLSLSGHATALWVVALALVAFGLGYGTYFPTAQNQIMSAVPREESGPAAAASSVVRVVAQLLGVVVFETIFSQRYALPTSPSYGTTTSPDALANMTSAFSLTFGLAAVIGLLALCPIFATTRLHQSIKEH